jgi:hypothetical protein
MVMTLTLYTEDPALITICQAYWQFSEDGSFLKNVTEIAATSGKSVNEVTRIAKQYSEFHSSGTFCRVCNIPYSYETRAEYLSRMHNAEWTCVKCKETAINEVWHAKYACVLQHAEEGLCNEIDPYSLTPKQLISFAALIRYAADESLTCIEPFESIREDEFSPRSDYSHTIISDLYRSRTLIVSQDSDLDHVTLKDDGGYSFVLNKAQFLIPHPDPKALIVEIDNILTSDDYAELNRNELKALAREISLQECLVYLERALSEHQLQYSLGEKTVLVLNKGLETYSVSQMYCFIWRAAKDAAAFYARSRVSRDHAAKTVVGNVEKQIERASANGWDVASYRRNFDHPQSILSRVLFNTVLKTADAGFEQPLDKLFGLEP